MKKNILIVDANPDILKIVVRCVQKIEGLDAIGAKTEDEAKNLFEYSQIDLVLIGGGINLEVENRLRSIFLEKSPNLKIVQHFGGGSGLLENEIRASFENNENGNFNVLT